MLEVTAFHAISISPFPGDAPPPRLGERKCGGWRTRSVARSPEPPAEVDPVSEKLKQIMKEIDEGGEDGVTARWRSVERFDFIYCLKLSACCSGNRSPFQIDLFILHFMLNLSVCTCEKLSFPAFQNSSPPRRQIPRDDIKRYKPAFLVLRGTKLSEERTLRVFLASSKGHILPSVILTPTARLLEKNARVLPQGGAAAVAQSQISPLVVSTNSFKSRIFPTCTKPGYLINLYSYIYIDIYIKSGSLRRL